jgi:dihydroxyacetone kinase
MAGCSITLLKLDDELTACGTRRQDRRAQMGG